MTKEEKWKKSVSSYTTDASFMYITYVWELHNLELCELKYGISDTDEDSIIRTILADLSGF